MCIKSIIRKGLSVKGGWVDRKSGLAAMEAFFNGVGDNSFFLWQCINLEMCDQSFLENK